jgi:peptidoglycan hydrolase FlgJ
MNISSSLAHSVAQPQPTTLAPNLLTPIPRLTEPLESALAAGRELAEPNGAEAMAAASEGHDDDSGPLRKAFDDLVGQTFYGMLLKSMRQTVGEPAYFNGGRAEQMFRNQLDQVLAERLSEASAEQFTGPMFELFQLGRP